MKAFHFTLEKMEHYRQQILDMEKDKLAALQTKRHELEAKMQQLERFAQSKQHEVSRRQQDGITAAELMCYSFFAQNIQAQRKDLKAALTVVEQQIDRQVKVVTDASRGMKSLEKLKEKQFEQYQKDEARERTEQITELVAMGI